MYGPVSKDGPSMEFGEVGEGVEHGLIEEE